MTKQPLAIDLCCGLGGWTEGLLEEGYRVVGFDIERHVYGAHRYPAQLVLQDVLTIHGSQLRNADLIVASPPCQEYSYMAMPWSIAKQKAADYEAGRRDVKQLTALFDACFRIQREASAAKGEHIPLVVENVRGAQRWVGRARYHFGSFYLWGDVPALMPLARKAVKVPTMGAGWYPPGHPKHVPGLAFNGHADRMVRLGEGVKAGDRNKGRANGDHKWTTDFAEAGHKNTGGSWFNIAHNTTIGDIEGVSFGSGVLGGNAKDYRGNAGSGQQHAPSIKNGGDWFGSGSDCSLQRRASSRSSARKAASAMIAKIPLVLSRHIAAAWYPEKAA